MRDTDHAVERYAEIEAIVLGKKPKTNYYTDENGAVIRDTISLNGDDWTFSQHVTTDNTVTEKLFTEAVSDYLAFKTTQVLKGEAA